MKKIALLTTLILTVLVACQPAEKKIDEIFPKKMDLLEYGIPITIQTPEDVKVTNQKDMLMQDVKIEGTNYHVYIYAVDASNPDTKALKSDMLTDLKADKYVKFSKMISEDDNGFLYELQAVGDTTKAYNFHYYKVQGNKEYHFTSSAGGRRPPFTLEQMQNMYKSVLPLPSKK